jgi:hexosaminidase
MMNWLYEAAPDYPQVEGFAEAGLRQIVCPGTSSWNTLFARLANARGNIRNFVAAGRRVGALGVLTTDWGDDGHPNLPASSWYGYAYTALEGWSPSQLDDEEFERRFAHLFFGREEAGAAMEAMRTLA